MILPVEELAVGTTVVRCCAACWFGDRPAGFATAAAAGGWGFAVGAGMGPKPGISGSSA